MAVALETFVKHLEDSGIISPSKLKVFLPPQASPKDAQELARQLIQQKQLTKFQAQEIYQGRAKSLILGNYTILDKIGAGGMGQVFKAEHRRMHRIVAIKTLPTKMMKDPAAVARFEREVHAAAKLSHPNIVAAHDADEANGVYFLVMEYVEGADLSALVKKKGPFPVAKACNYILQAARGLEFAHKKGVVHRDIKPANLLLDNEGTVKILDMGLARIDAGDGAAQAELTGTGMVMGTVDYMAPEQATSTHDADARADIYSLGCSLHYLIVGKATYGGETVIEKLLAHRDKPIPKLRESQPEVSDDLQALFEKMVAKTVEDRYQTMTEVIADLERSIAGMSTSFSGPKIVSAADAGTITFLKDVPAVSAKKTKAASLTKGNQKLVIGAPAAVVVILAIVGGWMLSGGRGGPKPDQRQAENERPTPPPGKPPGKPSRKAPPPPPVGPTKSESTAKVDHALVFDGKSMVQVLTINWGPLKEFTFEAFARPDDADGGGFVIDRYKNAALARYQGRWDLTVKYAGAEVPAYARSSIPPTPGQWDHLAGVVRDNVARLFVNGKLVEATPLVNPLEPGLGEKLEFGKKFTGAIRGIRISNVARYNAEFAPPKKLSADLQTLALYDFADGAGILLTDASGHRLHGQIAGAKWIPLEDASTDRDQQAPPAQAALPTAWTPRTMAEWTIRRGGNVWIGQQKDIVKIEDLPAEVTYLTLVSLDSVKDLNEMDLNTIISWSERFGLSFGLMFNNSTLTDEGLRRLAAIKVRGSLSLLKTSITGSGFDTWAGHSVGTLVVEACPISRAGWANIARLDNLVKLYAGWGSLSNDDLPEIVRRHPELELLSADGTQLSDAAIDHLQSLKNLTYLSIENTAITDAALPKLEKISSLQTLKLRNTKVTAAGIEALKKALPNCKIE